MFGHLKVSADRLAADAVSLRRERDLHARRGYEILKRRIGSPPALVAAFGAGVFAGARPRRRAPHPAIDDRRTSRSHPERAEGGFAHWALHGPVGAAAIKLATAFIAGAIMQPERAAGGSVEPGSPM